MRSGRPGPTRGCTKLRGYGPGKFWPPGTRGQETSAGGPFGSRRSAGRTPQVLPPAGPSSLTPSRPGEAKSRSREAPRCPSQLLASLTRKWPPPRQKKRARPLPPPKLPQIRTKHAIYLEIASLAGFACRIWPFYGLIWAYMGLYGQFSCQFVLGPAPCPRSIHSSLAWPARFRRGQGQAPGIWSWWPRGPGP